MKKLVRSGLGLVAALVSLPCIALAQATVPPAEPLPQPAPEVIEPTPPPPPVYSEPSMAPISPEPAVVTPPVIVVAEAAAEEAPAPSPTFSGYVEAAYHINFMDPDTDSSVPLHPYYDPPGNGFVLHAAHLAVAHSFSENISAVVEFDAGHDATLNGSIPYAGSFFDVQEAYATYKSGIFSFTAGKFVTYEGIEVIEGPLNPTVTRGLLYSFAEPFTHTGVKFHFTSETVDFGIGVVNGWDALLDNNNMKTLIFKLGLKPSDAFMVAVSGTVGPELGNDSDTYRVSLDLTGAWTASDSFALWFQANYGTDLDVPVTGTVSWYGFGLQPTYTSEKFTFGARVEFFADPDNYRVATATDASYIGFTLTPGFILAQGFKVRAELRADIATEKVLGKVNGMEPDPSKFQLTGALGAEYVF